MVVGVATKRTNEGLGNRPNLSSGECVRTNLASGECQLETSLDEFVGQRIRNNF
jgi:hypothetical protein